MRGYTYLGIGYVLKSIGHLVSQKIKDFIPVHKFIGLLSKWLTYLISTKVCFKNQYPFLTLTKPQTIVNIPTCG